MENILDDKDVLFKLNTVLSVIDGAKTFSQVSRDIGRTRKTVRKWVRDYEREGIGGLSNKPRGNVKAINSDAREFIIELKMMNRCRSNRRIRDILTGYGIKVHRQTV